MDMTAATAILSQPIISLVIVDDHPMFRRGIEQLVAQDGGFAVLAQAGSGQDGVDAVLLHRPDLAIIDLHMKGMDGIAVTRALQAAGCRSRLIMLTVSDSQLDIVEALNAGASGYLLKDMEPEHFCAELRKAAGGQTVLAPEARQVLDTADADAPTLGGACWDSLTAREQETLELLARGASNKLIARALDIAVSTVKVHVKHVLQKLELRNRFEAAVWMQQRGRGGAGL